MTNRSKLATIAMLLMLGVATPAFAGSINDDQTTTAKLDEVSYRHNDDQTTAAKLDEVSYRHNDDQTTAAKLDEASLRQGETARKMVYVAYSDSPARTGGGSEGYNSYNGHDSI